MPPKPTASWPVLLCSFVAAFCAAAAEPINIPIFLGHRGSTIVEDRRRYDQNLTPNQRRATIPIDNNNGSDEGLYYLTLSIGTPAQQFRFEVDLESPYSWVADISCTTGCIDFLELYNHSGSSTVTQISTGDIIHYGWANVSGNFVKDIVRLGPYTAQSQFFLAANKLSPDVPWAAVGILGLAYLQTAQGPSLPMSLFLDSQGQVALADMSFWLNRPCTAEYCSSLVGGAFTYGGTNTSLYQGEIDFLPTTGSSNASTWNLDVKGIIVQGTSVQITPGTSALSAFSLMSVNISGPALDVAAIWAAVPGSVSSTTHSGYYEFPCSTSVSVSISFGGRMWPIDPADMNLGPVEGSYSQCLGAIYTASNTTKSNGTANWIFGTVFMRNVYSVFRPSPFSIGFAELSSQSSNTNSRSTRWKQIVGPTVGIVGFAILMVWGNSKNSGTVVHRAPEYFVEVFPSQWAA
ncbi:Lysosomal aspartic protease [Mycena sanguinolenta]|uniref:Lysosomal aspartic protease n=1 Tax=Mycena sanguinolenta TaxID=230812 RepID=A0A8H7DLH8_9AGAR|nr:Lysosomal aspartic protease [Mycena sanguinolenta]